MRFNLTQLWQQYATFEASLKLWKTAAGVYEKALSDPIVGRYSDMFRLCSEYYIGRNKPVTAKNVYLTGLSGGLLAKPETDRLWCYLLYFMTGNSGSSITLAQLRDEMQSKLAAPLPELPSEAGLPALLDEIQSRPSVTAVYANLSSNSSKSNKLAAVTASTATIAAASAVTGGGGGIAAVKRLPESSSSSSSSLSTTAAVPAAVKPQPNKSTSVPTAAGTVDVLDSLFGLSSEQLIRLFHNRPPLLLVAPSKEPMKSGFKNLLPDEVNELERFLAVPLVSLLEPANTNDTARMRAEFILDILEEIWMSQALKERHFDHWFSELAKQRRIEVS
jgi:hypothetical protein